MLSKFGGRKFIFGLNVLSACIVPLFLIPEVVIKVAVPLYTCLGTLGSGFFAANLLVHKFEKEEKE